jgi:ribA/ribD-fused uncharacterized protein
MGDPEVLKTFYKARDKLLEKDEKKLGSLLFDYDDDGNLVEKNKDGGIVKTISLPNYRPLSFEEFDEMDKKRDEAIAIAMKQFEDARNNLYQEYQNPERNLRTIIQLNRQMLEADEQLQFSRFPLRYVSKEDGIVIRTIDFKQPTEVRKFPYDIAIFKTNPYPLQEQYVRLGEAPPKPIISVSEIKEEKSKEVPIILFEKTDANEFGFLSLDWAVQIPFNSMNYHSVKQALTAELAKQFNDQSHLDEILQTDSPEEITYSLKDVPGDKDANEAKWNENTKKLLYDINLVKFTQYPELGNRLLETQNAILGAYFPDDTLMGIGISLDRLESKNPIHWTGQNILGKVLMDIREYLKKQQPSVEAKPVSVKRRKPPTKSLTTSNQSSSSSTSIQPVSLVPTVASLPVTTTPASMAPSMPLSTPNQIPTVASMPVSTSNQASSVGFIPVSQASPPAGQELKKIRRKPFVAPSLPKSD